MPTGVGNRIAPLIYQTVGLRTDWFQTQGDLSDHLKSVFK